jgi:hypothetical protein
MDMHSHRLTDPGAGLGSPRAEMILHRALVEDIVDHTVLLRAAEGIVGGLVSVAAGRGHADALRRAVGLAEVVQRPGEVRVERADGAVRGDARIASSAEMSHGPSADVPLVVPWSRSINFRDSEARCMAPAGGAETAE